MDIINKKIKIGLVGLGHLGKIHLKNILQIPEFELIGIFDTDKDALDSISKEYNIHAVNSIDELINLSDAVDIVTPTKYHFEIAKRCISAGKHIFIEKPVTAHVTEGRELIELSKDKNLKIQVGHVERFNPAFVAAKDYIINPKFIEAHRLSEFKPRGIDVSVILDLMIHDLDLILSTVNSKVEKISAVGIPVISDQIDIANARVEFENGTVANLTASRVSIKNERKMRFFVENAYISIDLLKKETNIFNLNELEESDIAKSELVFRPSEDKKRKEVNYFQPVIKESNAIEQELRNFAVAILNDTPPIVGLKDGMEALELAYLIINECTKNYLKASSSLV